MQNKILIVDDDPTNIEILKEQLHEIGMPRASEKINCTYRAGYWSVGKAQKGAHTHCM